MEAVKKKRQQRIDNVVLLIFFSTFALGILKGLAPSSINWYHVTIPLWVLPVWSFITACITMCTMFWTALNNKLNNK
tara:strand:+ start:155 stop:385 length:231 start_codon:yes stop_codon:yes gene_type:complete